MRPRKPRGEGTVADLGRYDTQGERKRLSPVAAAIASTEPGSGTSGDGLVCAGNTEAKISSRANIKTRDRIMLGFHSPRQVASRQFDCEATGEFTTPEFERTYDERG